MSEIFIEEPCGLIQINGHQIYICIEPDCDQIHHFYVEFAS